MNQINQKWTKEQQTRYASEQNTKQREPPLPEWFDAKGLNKFMGGGTSEESVGPNMTKVMTDEGPQWAYIEDVNKSHQKAEAMDMVTNLVRAWEKSKSKFHSESDVLINAIRIIIESLD